MIIFRGGDTPRHLDASDNNKKCLELLRTHSAEVNAKNNLRNYIYLI